MSRKDNRFLFFICCVLVLVSFGCIYWQKISAAIPDNIYIYENDEAVVNVNKPVIGCVYSGDDIVCNDLDFSGNVTFNAGDTAEYTIEYKLFGIFPIASSKVLVVEPKTVYAGGFQLGIFLKLDGIFVEKLETITTIEKNNISPCYGDLCAGDYIVSVNDLTISSKDEFAKIVSESEGSQLKLGVRRNNELISIYVTPVKDISGKYKLGIWIKDDTQGVGTVTFIDSDNNIALLGHGISYGENKLLEISSGKLYRAKIVSIIQGKDGEPGELLGTINYKNTNVSGIIESNKNSGIYGFVSSDFVEEYNLEQYETAPAYKVHTGKAFVQFLNEGQMNQYEINIDKIRLADDKNITFTVVSEDLISITNGIVQGMSGCPIIQDGKLIGAVTHVFVDDSKRGYGIFIDNMLN